MAIEMALTNQEDKDSIIKSLRGRGLNRVTFGAVFGLLGGILAPLFGSRFTAIGWISGPTWHGFAVHRIGTVLLFLTIPLLLFGAHCLDLVDRDNKQEEIRRFPDQKTTREIKEGENNDLGRD